MALYADRVKQSLGITGTGTVTLTLATTGTGYQSFLSAFGTGTQTVAYCIADQSGFNWEVGTGDYNGSANTLARTTVLASSNGGSLTNFSGGTQDVFCTAPAKFLDTFTSTNQGTVPASGGGTTNFLRADGTFAAPPATAPAGSNTQIQFNNAGAFGATAGFSYNTSGVNYVFNIAPANINAVIIGPVAPTGSQTSTPITIGTQNASATNGVGGSITVSTGNGLGSGASGGMSFTTGSSVTATAGGMTFTTGAGNPNGGAITFQGGNGRTPNGGGGSVVMRGGQAVGSGTGGSFTLESGFANTGPSGSFNLLGGASTSGVGGSFQLLAGYGGAGSGSIRIGSDSNDSLIRVTETLLGVGQIGFYGTTPVARPAAYTKTYSTASRTIPNATFTNLVTTAATNVTPYGFATQAQADEIATKVNALAADVLILKQLIVSLVNDSSKTLGVGLNNT